MGCFPLRETRQCCGQMFCGLLMELDDHNCWTIADAVGHRGPHWPQDLLAEDLSGYVASIISRRITLLELIWDLDNTPLSGRKPHSSPGRVPDRAARRNRGRNGLGSLTSTSYAAPRRAPRPSFARRAPAGAAPELRRA